MRIQKQKKKINILFVGKHMCTILKTSTYAPKITEMLVSKNDTNIKQLENFDYFFTISFKEDIESPGKHPEEVYRKGPPMQLYKAETPLVGMKNKELKSHQWNGTNTTKRITPSVKTKKGLKNETRATDLFVSIRRIMDMRREAPIAI